MCKQSENNRNKIWWCLLDLKNMSRIEFIIMFIIKTHFVYHVTKLGWYISYILQEMNAWSFEKWPIDKKCQVMQFSKCWINVMPVTRKIFWTNFMKNLFQKEKRQNRKALLKWILRTVISPFIILLEIQMKNMNFHSEIR